MLLPNRHASHMPLIPFPLKFMGLNMTLLFCIVCKTFTYYSTNLYVFDFDHAFSPFGKWLWNLPCSSRMNINALEDFHKKIVNICPWGLWWSTSNHCMKLACLSPLFLQLVHPLLEFLSKNHCFDAFGVTTIHLYNLYWHAKLLFFTKSSPRCDAPMCITLYEVQEETVE